MPNLPNGTKGNPRWDLDDGSDFPVDLTALSDWVASVVDTTVADTTALAALFVWTGRMAHVAADDSIRVWDGAAWRIIVELDSATVAVTPESDFYNVVAFGSWGALSVRKSGQLVMLNGHISSDGGTAGGSTWAYIPVGYRPPIRQNVFARIAGDTSSIYAGQINTDGALVIDRGNPGSAMNLIVSAHWMLTA